MSRFTIVWSEDDRAWDVLRLGRVRDGRQVVASFSTLLEAENYVIERGTRSER